MQNPPSVPTLAAVKLASWIRCSKFIVDWHNFGYTLLAISHGRSHLIVKVYHWYCFLVLPKNLRFTNNINETSNLFLSKYKSCNSRFERFFGRMSDGSLCVTKAMQHELAQNWKIK